MDNSQIIIAEIQQNIDWYGQYGPDASINMLMDKRDQLACKSWYLAEIAAEMKTGYNKSRFVKTIHISRQKMELVSKGKKVNQAEIEATIQGADLYEVELDKEALAYRLDRLYNAVGNILAAMQQRISYAKIEDKESKRQV